MAKNNFEEDVNRKVVQYTFFNKKPCKLSSSQNFARFGML